MMADLSWVDYANFGTGVVSTLATSGLAWIVYRYTRRTATHQSLDALDIRVDDIDRELSFVLDPEEKATVEAIEAAAAKDNKTVANIFALLNAYESMCAGVLVGHYDEQMVRKLRESATVGTFDRFEDFIKRHRESTRVRTAWANLEELANRWRAG